MVNFICNNLIRGKLSWERVQKSKIYAPYIDAVVEELDRRGYYIDEDGNCVPKPADAE